MVVEVQFFVEGHDNLAQIKFRTKHSIKAILHFPKDLMEQTLTSKP